MDNCTTQRFSDEERLLGLVHILKPYTFQSEFRTVLRCLVFTSVNIEEHTITTFWQFSNVLGAYMNICVF